MASPLLLGEAASIVGISTYVANTSQLSKLTVGFVLLG